MLSEAHIAMEAVDGATNCYRSWSLTVDRDLFGELTVSVSYGRLGSRGRIVMTACADEHAAGRYIRSALARRATAPRRIGTAYRVTSQEGMTAFLR